MDALYKRHSVEFRRLVRRLATSILLYALALAFTPAAKAALPALPGQTIKPAVAWQAYTARANDLPADLMRRMGLAAGDAGLLLRISVTPPPEHYLYAPFSPGLSERQRLELAELGMPLSFSLLTADGLPLAGTRPLYPPGKLKYDAFSDAELPIYDSPVELAAWLPMADMPLILNLEGLLCSDTACTPVRGWHELDLPRAYGLAAAMPAEVAARLAQYRVFPEAGSTGAATEKKPEAAFTVPNTAASPPAGITNGHKPTRQAYAGMFTPKHFQQALEVYGLGRAVLFGLLAGLFLNFMPCVLPVVMLKLGALAGLGGLHGLPGDNEPARRSRARLRGYSLFFSLGVLVWFAALFALIGLAGLMWGQFFQSQTLLEALALILFLLALSLFGIFRLPILPPTRSDEQGAGNMAAKSASRRQAFSSGLLATLLATPCSGPLLGGVLAWAVGQPLHLLGVTLLGVGLGMASPFILLSLRPGLARFLPRPGNWMLMLEKIMGFMLLGTVLYLLSMLPGDKTIIFLAALLLLAFAVWLWSRKRAVIRLLASVTALCALYLALCAQPGGESGDAAWQTFEPAKFEALLGKRNLLLDFTADWCINCRVMEATTLSEGNRVKLAKSYNLIYIKVDITRNNTAGEELLASMGGASIPLLSILPAGPGHANPTVLRDLVTSGQLDEALSDALP